LENSKLNNLQNEVLAAFFAREDRFFLTGGAALAGFYLGHRETNDLDLFTLTDALDDGVALLREIGRSLEAAVESIQTSPNFRRLLMRRDREAVVVDLVRDHSPQNYAVKNVVQGIRIDRPEEILANKLCTLLSRAEIRNQRLLPRTDARKAAPG
jgi:hypothetical protein